jgi:hypothetical protein
MNSRKPTSTNPTEHIKFRFQVNFELNLSNKQMCEKKKNNNNKINEKPHKKHRC